MLQQLNNIKSLRKAADILAGAFVFIFPLITFIQLYPFHQSLQDILLASDDDWCLYITTALDIKHHGLLISSVQGDYDYPNGFFYSYFVAFCFTLFGESPAPVYIVQAFLLGATIALVYNTFKSKMSALAGLLFISTLIVFAFLDVHKYYTFRFLSENLVIFTLALFFYFLKKGLEKMKTEHFGFSAIFLGLSTLTRPNLFPVALVFFLALCFLAWRGKIQYRSLIIFYIMASGVICLLALRNILVSGHLTFFPVSSLGFFRSYLFHPIMTLELVFKKLLFCTGFLPVLDPSYNFRPHWILMWIAYLYYLLTKLKVKGKLTSFEIITHLFIFSYFGLLIFVIQAELLTIYGFRYVFPGVFIVLPYVFLEFDFFRDKQVERRIE